jgi:hypothetical protein
MIASCAPETIAEHAIQGLAISAIASQPLLLRQIKAKLLEVRRSCSQQRSAALTKVSRRATNFGLQDKGG